MSFNNIHEITENLYLGNLSAAEDIDKLKELGIKKILSVLEEINWPKYEDSQFMHKALSIQDVDKQNIIKYFSECLHFIKGDDKVLVHCVNGINRSASIVIAYLMWTKKMTFKDAFEFVERKRFIFPNFGFREQLQLFEKELIKNNYDIEKIKFEEIKWEPKNYNEFLK